jgi:hypothetical protein
MLKDDAVQSGTHLPTFRNNVLPRSYTTNMKACLRTAVMADGMLRIKNALAKSVFCVTELTI